MDIVVKGRNVEVPEHYRVLVEEKLARLGRYDRKVIRFDVELLHEPNRRQSKACQRVEITGKSKGPAVRAEACAADFYAALDCAVAKLESRLRRTHDRRRAHHGRKAGTSVAAATAGAPRLIDDTAGVALLEATDTIQETLPETTSVPAQRSAEPEPDELPDGPGQVVRRKQHASTPMNIDQALYEMELVGHDFYLFHDEASGCPSVVYRRRGFDYGVIALT